MSARPARKLVALCVLASLALTAACVDDDTVDPPGATTTLAARLYGADGNMSNSFGALFDDFPEALNGMKGTTPLTPLTEDFKDRLLEIDPTLAHFSYAGEAYDAVAIVAIAAAYGQTTDPVRLSSYIVGATTDGTTCETIASCLELARDGEDLQYRGISLRHSGFTDLGEPSSATYGAVSFARDNNIDDSRTEYVTAGDENSQSTTASPDPVTATPTPLIIGGLIPHSGRLASFGPTLEAAIQLAVSDVNAAGGVLSSDVRWIDGDDGTNTQTALATTRRLISQGAQVIIGAGASSVTQDVIPEVVAAKRVLFSPTSTSDDLTAVEDSGLFFRTAPPDGLQARALANIILRDGPTRVAIAAIDESYGIGLARNVQSQLLLAGIDQSNLKIFTYEAKDSYNDISDVIDIFDPIAEEIVSFSPNAILIVGSDESAHLVRSLLS